jgi:hypothetical protein
VPVNQSFSSSSGVDPSASKSADLRVLGVRLPLPAPALLDSIGYGRHPNSPVSAITFPNSVMDGSSGIGHSVIAMAPSLNLLFPVGGNARNERGLAAIPLRVAQTAD